MNSKRHNFAYKNQKQSQSLFNFVFFTPIFFLKAFKLENKFNFFHIIKFNILFDKCPKYEIISLTFGPSKVV
jgi:hypothetical protein